MPAQSRLLIAGLLIVTAVVTVGSIIAQSTVPLPTSFNLRTKFEMLANPGFEVDGNADKVPDGWKATNTALKERDRLICDKPGKPAAHSGKCAFRFSGNPDGTTSKLKQTILNADGLVDGTEIVFGLYLDPRTVVPQSLILKAKINFNDNRSLKLSSLTLSLPTTSIRTPDDYLYLDQKGTLNMPAGVSVKNVKVTLGYSGITGKFLIDDVSFRVDNLALPFELMANDGSHDDYFGHAVAISGDTIVVGAKEGYNGSGWGSAYVYIRDGSTWIQQQKLVLDADHSFGYSTAIADNTILIGGPWYNNDIPGLVDEFVPGGGVWSEHQKITAADSADPYSGFGFAVTIDGDTLIVGAPRARIGTNASQGAVYVFERTDGVWTQQTQLIADDGTEDDNFGTVVAIHGDTLVVGAPFADANGYVRAGSVYVFQRTAGIWTQQVKLAPGEISFEDYFGCAVAINENALIVGASGNNDLGDWSGAVYVFEKQNSAWVQKLKLHASDETDHDYFGSALAMNGDTLLVKGADTVYMYRSTNSTWTEAAKLKPTHSANGDDFGVSIAIENNTAVIGAPGTDHGDNVDQGSAWVFALP